MNILVKKQSKDLEASSLFHKLLISNRTWCKPTSKLVNKLKSDPPKMHHLVPT